MFYKDVNGYKKTTIMLGKKQTFKAKKKKNRELLPTKRKRLKKLKLLILDFVFK